MPGLSHMAHAARQIIWTKNNAVESWHREDFIDALDRVNVFDLYYREDRLIGSLAERGASLAPVARRPPRPVATNALRRIAASRHGSARFVWCPHVGHDDAFRSKV